MTVSNHLQELDGLPAFDFPDAEAEPKAELPDAGSVAWRVGVDAYDSEEEWEEAFARFLAAVDPTRVRALIVGAWSEAYETAPDELTAALIAASDRLPRCGRCSSVTSPTRSARSPGSTRRRWAR